MLLIWLAGGASQLETWDPKPKTDTGGPFRSIETSRARRADFRADATNREANAPAGTRAERQHQGRRPWQRSVPDAHRASPDAGGQDYPHLGSLVAKSCATEAESSPRLHPCHRRRRRRGSTEAAFLGPKYNALYLGNGQRRPTHRGPTRSVRRGRRARSDLATTLNDRFAKRRRTAETDAYTTTYEQALQLMERREVFDVTKEPPATWTATALTTSAAIACWRAGCWKLASRSSR